MSLYEISSPSLIIEKKVNLCVNRKIINIGASLMLPFVITLFFSGCSSQSPSEAEIKEALGGDKISELVIRKISKEGRVGDGPMSLCHGGFEDLKNRFSVELSYAKDLGPCSSSGFPKLPGRTCGPSYWDGVLCITKDDKGNWAKSAMSTVYQVKPPAKK